MVSGVSGNSSPEDELRLAPGTSEHTEGTGSPVRHYVERSQPSESSYDHIEESAHDEAGSVEAGSSDYSEAQDAHAAPSIQLQVEPQKVDAWPSMQLQQRLNQKSQSSSSVDNIQDMTHFPSLEQMPYEPILEGKHASEDAEGEAASSTDEGRLN